jgi:hypothetical protein
MATNNLPIGCGMRNRSRNRRKVRTSLDSRPYNSVAIKQLLPPLDLMGPPW